MSPLMSVRGQLPSSKARILHENKVVEKLVDGAPKKFVLREVGKIITDFSGLRRYRVAPDGSIRHIV